MEADTSRFEELLRSLWQCHIADLRRLSGESSDFLPRLPPSSRQTKLPKAHGPGAFFDIHRPTSTSPQFGGTAAKAHGGLAFLDMDAAVGGNALQQDQHRARVMDVAADATGAARQQKGAAIDSTVPVREESNFQISELSEKDEEVIMLSRGLSGTDLGMKQLWEYLANNKSEALAPVAKRSDTQRDAVTTPGLEVASFEENELQVKTTGCGRLISSPGSPRRLIWDMFGGFLVMYDMIKIPLTVFEPPPSAFTVFMDWVTLIFWSLDVPASFFAGYFVDGVEVMEPRRIAKNYLGFWFIIDIGIVIPDWIFTLVLTAQNGDSVRLLRSLRIVRILRLVRLLKLKWIIDAFIDYVDSEAVSMWVNIVRMIFVLVCMNHFLSCIWYAIGSVDSRLPRWTDDFEGASWGHFYCLAMHWSVTQFTPASMSVQPANIYERAFAICVVFFALVVFSYIVGSITGSLTALRELGQATSRQFWHLRRYLKRNNVPSRLTKRIINFIGHAHSMEEKKMNVAQVTIMRHLSPQLMAELKCSMTLPHLEVHPLFAHLNENATITLNNIAKDAVSQSSLARSDILFLPSQTSSAMYFVTQGRVLYTRILLSGGIKAEMVDADEDWIAEPALWCAAWLHVGEAKAETEVDLLLVDAKRFEEILNLVRPMARLCAVYAQAFLGWLKLTDLTDVIQGDQEADRICDFIPKD